MDREAIEFSDFIVHAINENILQSNDRLATAFNYFDTDYSYSNLGGMDAIPGQNEEAKMVG